MPMKRRLLALLLLVLVVMTGAALWMFVDLSIWGQRIAATAEVGAFLISIIAWLLPEPLEGKRQWKERWTGNATGPTSETEMESGGRVDTMRGPEANAPNVVHHLPAGLSGGDYYYPVRLSGGSRSRLTSPSFGDGGLDSDLPVVSEDALLGQGEADVLESWVREPGVHVVVGAPGAGKSTLLKRWTDRLQMRRESDPTAPVPIYVPLRDLELEDTSFAEVVRRYWQGRVADCIVDVSPYLRGDLEVTPVWLIDGLDEIPFGPDTGRRWVEAIRNLGYPSGGEAGHVCIASCRTALYEGEFGAPMVLRGLNVREQLEFARDYSEELDAIYPELAQGRSSDAFWQTLLTDPHLGRMSANPLQLRLLLEFGIAQDGRSLPKNRSEFFEKAFFRILEQRGGLGLGRGLSVAWRLHRVLVELVGRVQLNPTVSYGDIVNVLSDVGDVSEADWQHLLECGILQPRGLPATRFEFLHPTFQEWFLAQHLLEDQGFEQAVVGHWTAPTFRETLSLLWAEGTPADRESATQYLLAAGCQELESDGRIVVRSGLRTALHLWGRSGVSLAGHTQARDQLIEAVSKCRQVCKEAIAWDSDVPPEVLGAIADTGALIVLRGLASNPQTPRGVLIALSRHENPDIASLVGRNSSSDVEVLRTLGQRAEPEVLAAVLRHPRAPGSLLKSLAEVHRGTWLQVVASDPSTPSEELDALSVRTERKLRVAVAGNPSACVDTLWRLARGGDVEVQVALVRNRNSPDVLLRHLARQRRGVILEALAWSSRTPGDVLETLVESEDVSVLRALAMNPSAPRRILLRLLGTGFLEVWRMLAWNSATPSSVLEVLSKVEEPAILQAVATNPHTPSSTLRALSTSNHWAVLQGLAMNRTTPIDVLEALGQKDDERILWMLASNVNTPARVLHELARSEGVAGRAAMESVHSCLEWSAMT